MLPRGRNLTLSDGRWPAPGVTSTKCCGCGRMWSVESASDSAALRVFSTSHLPSCSSRSLCPRSRAARFPGAETGCSTATAPRRGARYTPLPREVSRPGWGPQGAGWTARVCCGGQGWEGSDLDWSTGPSAGCSLGKVEEGG